MADNYLITGYWGEPHVTVENDRGINAAMFGTGRFVLPVGEQFRAEYIGNNTVRMYDGKLMDNGAAAGIPAGEYVDLLISNAGQGMKRNDLIVFQYSQDASTLIESGIFEVIQGAETSGTASDPKLTQEDLLSNTATFDQMALWRVSVSGATISAPVKVFELRDHRADFNAHTSNKSNPHNVTISQIGASPAKHANQHTPNGSDPITAAMIQAAPSGYGLGETSGKSCTNCNDAVQIGWYSLSGSSVANAPLELGYANMEVQRRWSTLWQIVKSEKTVAKRHATTSDNGATWTFGEWMYTNPPLRAGTEYPTSEQYNAKTVYVKCVYHKNSSAYGNMNSITEVSFAHGISGWGALVRVEAKQNVSFPLPTITSTGGSVSVSRVDATNIYLRFANTSFDSRDWYFVVYYTK